MKKIDNQRPLTPSSTSVGKETTKADQKKTAAKFKAALEEKAATGMQAKVEPESVYSTRQEPEIAVDESETAGQQTSTKPPGGKAEVPDSWKHPDGPYHQAPAEYGGEWWYVSPFTGSEPWKNAAQQAEIKAGGGKPAQTFPEGFIETFPKPERSQYRNGIDYTHAISRWKDDLKYFKQSGMPPGVDQEKIAAAFDVAKQWGLGTPAIYEGRYGWAVRFPESQIPTFETNLSGLTMGIHQTVAQYQVRLMQNGISVLNRHPMVPPHVEPRVFDK